MGYINYETSGVENVLKNIPEKTKADDDKLYDRGISFRMQTDEKGVKYEDDIPKSYIVTEYLLNGVYKSLKGKVVSMWDEYKGDYGATLNIYGDSELIYKSPIIDEGTKSIDLDVNVEKYKTLKIVAEIPQFEETPITWYKSNTVGIANARLEKK